MKAHGTALLPQHRVQAADRAGVHLRRDAQGRAKRHDISRNLIRIWVQKYEAGALDDDATAADMIHEYEARIAVLKPLAGKQALEFEFLKGL